MTKRLNDKVALVTGAASGIGWATVMRFLEEGSRVVASDVNREGLEDLAKECCDSLLKTRVVDVGERSQCEGMATTAEFEAQRQAVTERRVNLYLARVVDELVSFEDALTLLLSNVRVLLYSGQVRFHSISFDSTRLDPIRFVSISIRGWLAPTRRGFRFPSLPFYFMIPLASLPRLSLI